MLDSAAQKTLDNEIHRLCDLFGQGSIQGTLDQAKQLLKRFPEATALHIIAGDANTKLKQFDAAIKSYKKAIDLKPNFSVSYFNLGVAFQDKGDFKEAIRSYRKAININPEYAAAYLNMGLIFKKLGDLETAIRSFRQATKFKPDCVESYLNMGDALNNKGDLETAINNYKQVMKLKPENLRAYDGISFSIRYYTRATHKGLIGNIEKIDELIDSEKQKLRTLLKKNKLWFVDIPRTSSTVIKVLLGRTFGWPFGQNNFGSNDKYPNITRSLLLPDHTPAFIAKKHIGDNLWDELDTFTIVRNPYRWSSSLWHYTMKNNDLGLRIDTFDQFLGSLEEKLVGEFSNREIHPSSYRQTDYLLNVKGKVLVKHLLQYEENKKIDKFLTANGILDYSKSPIYVGTKSSDHNINQCEKKKIDRIFEKDFEILGY